MLWKQTETDRSDYAADGNVKSHVAVGAASRLCPPSRAVRMSDASHASSPGLPTPFEFLLPLSPLLSLLFALAFISHSLWLLPGPREEFSL